MIDVSQRAPPLVDDVCLEGRAYARSSQYLTVQFVGRLGFEPRTYGLKIRSSNLTELSTRSANRITINLRVRCLARIEFTCQLLLPSGSHFALHRGVRDFANQSVEAT